MSKQDGTKILGEGRLSWPRRERIGDRYGVVMLMLDGDSLSPTTGYVRIDPAISGQRGSLVAEVIQTRQSTHIGDLFRGLGPSTPDVGDRIQLGSGTAFLEHEDWEGDGGAVDLIGLMPDDGRRVDWLDPQALYRCHEQTVRLFFEPESAGE